MKLGGDHLGAAAALEGPKYSDARLCLVSASTDPLNCGQIIVASPDEVFGGRSKSVFTWIWLMSPSAGGVYKRVAALYERTENRQRSPRLRGDAQSGAPAVF